MGLKIGGFAVAVLTLASPAHGVLVKLQVDGKVIGNSYGPVAANDIYVAAPIGSAVRFSFQYDTSLAPTSYYPAFGGFKPSADYVLVSINGSLMIGSTTFVLPVASFFSGDRYSLGSRFSVYAAAPFSSTRIEGYQMLDLGMTILDPTYAALQGELPSSIDLDVFPMRYFYARFAFGPNHETILDFSVDQISNLAVPEPASWAMMIAGFGLLGTAARRRKRVTVSCV